MILALMAVLVQGVEETYSRSTFMAWLPGGSFYVAEGYNGTACKRVRQHGLARRSA